MVIVKSGCPTEVPAAGMSDIGRTGGGRVLAWHTGLLVDAWAWEPSKLDWYHLLGIHPWLHDSSECFTHRVYGTCTGIGSSGEKPRNKPHQLCLTHLGEDLLNVVSTCSAILVHLSSWFLAKPSHLRSNSYSSWALAWVTTCSCLRATLKPSSFLVCQLKSLWEWGGSGDWQLHKGGKQWSSPELSHRASLRNGMTFSLSPSFSHGRMTWVEEYRNNPCRCSLANGNWAVEAPTESVVTSM